MIKLGVVLIGALAAFSALPAAAQPAAPPIMLPSQGGADLKLAKDAAVSPPPAAGSGSIWRSVSVKQGADGSQTTTMIIANPPVPNPPETPHRTKPSPNKAKAKG